MAVYEYDSQNDKLNRIAGGTLYADLPIGFIIPSFETVAPLGFLKLTDTLANRTVSRTTYKELFDWATERDLIGTGKPFGVGDGSTTFVIPDGKEIAFKGVGEYEGTVGNHVKSGGLANGEFIDDRLQDHTHFEPTGGGQYGTNPYYMKVGYYDETIIPTQKYMVDCRHGDTTEVKSLGCHYYIKAKNVGVPADFVSEIDDVIGERLSYSYAEHKTGKKWVDGKDIYSTTYVLINVNLSSTPRTIGQIDNIPIANIVKKEVIVKNIGLDVLVGENQYSIYLSGNAILGLQTISSTTTGWDVYYTLEYTKSS